jgi:diketogulonate reductase-like aldo/keto reductase
VAPLSENFLEVESEPRQDIFACQFIRVIEAFHSMLLPVNIYATKSGLTVLAELDLQGLIRHLGVSNVTPEQLTEA